MVYTPGQPRSQELNHGQHRSPVCRWWTVAARAVVPLFPCCLVLKRRIIHGTLPFPPAAANAGRRFTHFLSRFSPEGASPQLGGAPVLAALGAGSVYHPPCPRDAAYGGYLSSAAYGGSLCTSGAGGHDPLPGGGHASGPGIFGQLWAAEAGWGRGPDLPHTIQYHLSDSFHCPGLFVQRDGGAAGTAGLLNRVPHRSALALAATLNSLQGYVVGNAAIVAAGTSGSIDVFASNATDLVIDINGYYASLTDLLGNTALGTGALASNTSGSSNTASGLGALSANTTGSDNTASGYQALQKNNGDNNTANGFGGLYSNTAGSSNTARGAYALYYNTTGDQNTASGHLALQSNINGVGNTASGYQALQNNTGGSDNTASGYQALQKNSVDGNTANGYQALLNNTTGNNNTANGYQALQGPTTGSNGSDNTASGYQALQSNTGGYKNTASGYQALQSNTTGVENTASGYQALQKNTGGNNTAIGAYALYSNTTGTANTAIGDGALGYNTGSGNIAIGAGAGSGVFSGNSNNIHIGTNGGYTDGGVIRIGGSNAFGDEVQLQFFAAGIYNANSGGNAVSVNSLGQLSSQSSSRRFKQDIRDMGDNTDAVMGLRPVRFRYKAHRPDGPEQYGLIAEEVQEVAPEVVGRGQDGQIDSVRYDQVNVMLLNEVQKQNRELQAQKQHAQQQDETIRQQQEQNRKLEARLAALEAMLPGKVPPAAAAGQ